MATAPAVPSPSDVFGPNRPRSLRPQQVHAQAVDTVLAQCRERLRRGVPAANVTTFLRGQYVRLAALAAVVEVAADQLVDPTPTGVVDVKDREAACTYNPAGPIASASLAAAALVVERAA